MAMIHPVYTKQGPSMLTDRDYNRQSWIVYKDLADWTNGKVCAACCINLAETIRRGRRS